MKKGKIDLSEDVADDRRHIAGLLTDALNSLAEPQEYFMAAIRKIVAYHEEETGCYPVVSLSKDDIREAGYNPDGLGPDDMRNIANHMPEENMMESYWVSLKYHIENDRRLPELRTEIDSLYEAYKEEAGKEPLYAEVWLEDKGYNNQPWPVAVKLSLDVDEQEDEQIYMNFSGFEEMKQWLFSLEDDKNSDVDWCYDDPQHRIVFTDKLCPDGI